MNVLLTNDDGIRAPGILAMYEALIDREGFHGGPVGGVVYPIAPLTVQSATSHGVTFHVPLMVERQSVELTGEGRMEGVSVDGRPADCVKLAICNLWPERFGPGSRPDLVISGMNDGANCGINVLYSGTVAAAIEAAFLGVPSIAVSMQRGRGRSRFDVGAKWARRVIDMLIKDGLPKAHECLSINIPLCEDDGTQAEPPMPRVKVCPMNVHGLVDKYEARKAPTGATYYWAAGHGLDFKGTDAGSDVQELMAGSITVTPLRYDMTAHEALAGWRARLGG
jgi:5'-nucleotidase